MNPAIPHGTPFMNIFGVPPYLLEENKMQTTTTLEVELYVPTTDNNGRRPSLGQWKHVESVLSQFGGFSAYDVVGYWRSGDTGKTYKETVHIYRVLFSKDDNPEGLPCLKRLAEYIKRIWRQETVLVTVKTAEIAFI